MQAKQVTQGAIDGRFDIAFENIKQFESEIVSGVPYVRVSGMFDKHEMGVRKPESFYIPNHVLREAFSYLTQRPGSTYPVSYFNGLHFLQLTCKCGRQKILPTTSKVYYGRCKGDQCNEVLSYGGSELKTPEPAQQMPTIEVTF